MKQTKKILISLLCATLLASMLGACSTPDSTTSDVKSDSSTSTTEQGDFNGKLVFDHTTELTYAKLFKLDYYKGGYKGITVTAKDGTTQKILTVPEGMDTPTEIESDTIVLQMPLTNVLISSTPTISLINAMGALDRVSLTTTAYDSWYIDSVKAAMDAKKITYIGDYKEPDYEILATTAPAFSVFPLTLSTTPQVIEKFAELNIPIMLEQSAYEDHPLARVEWVKLYGALFDSEDAANAVFAEQMKYVEEIPSIKTDETVAIFYVTSNNVLYARKGGDYMSKMVELAGGDYIFSDMNPDETGTNKMDFESFYAQAKDVDHIIYVWSMGGKPETMADFTAKNELFSDLKAVKNGNVWCTTPNFFQNSDTLGYMIKDINTMMTLADDTDELTYLFRLK